MKKHQEEKPIPFHQQPGNPPKKEPTSRGDGLSLLPQA